MSLDDLDRDSRLAPNGMPWWKLKQAPNSNRAYGGEKRLAAFLWFNKDIGDIFTMRELRSELGEDDTPEYAEHLNRRLRALRPDDWNITANNTDRTLPPDTYRLDRKGRRVWLGERNPRDKVSSKTRRLVLDRDGNRCMICGVATNEEYPGEPGTKARLTIGHRIPGQRLGGAHFDNLRTECARCNEPVRDHIPDPEKYDEVWPSVRALRKGELEELLAWLEAGQRLRSRLDKVYDRLRQLSPSERDRMREAVGSMLGS